MQHISQLCPRLSTALGRKGEVFMPLDSIEGIFCCCLPGCMFAIHSQMFVTLVFIWLIHTITHSLNRFMRHVQYVRGIKCRNKQALFPFKDRASSMPLNVQRHGSEKGARPSSINSIRDLAPGLGSGQGKARERERGMRWRGAVTNLGQRACDNTCLGVNQFNP